MIYKVLLIHSFTVNEEKPVWNAISYHRILQPHRVLSREFPEYECHHVPSASGLTEEFLENFKLVIFLRAIDDMEIVPKLRKLGIKFGIDEDDYWILPTTNPAYEAYKANNYTNKIIESIKVSDFVICTTPILQDKIKELNPNVYIIENGIDSMDSAWIPKRTESERIRFGFLGGSTHIYDIYKISYSVVEAMKNNTFKKKCQIALAFQYKEGEPSNYVGYEKLLTDHFKTLEFDYRKKLLQGLNPDGTKQNYRRLQFKPVEEFATLYNDIDVSLCPLDNTEFNNCKSELKMIEAGFMGVSVMVSNVNPYSLICTPENSFMFDRGDFFYHAKKIMKEPNLIQDKSLALRETVVKYDLRLLSKKRNELYKEYIR